MSRVVLDASALLALLNAEPGAEQVAKALGDGVIGAVNLAEVVAKLSEHGMPEDAIQQSVGGLGLEVFPFDTELAYLAGLLRRPARAHGLSLGDRACLALGRQLGLPVLTADKAWAALKVGVKVRVIR